MLDASIVLLVNVCVAVNVATLSVPTFNVPVTVVLPVIPTVPAASLKAIFALAVPMFVFSALSAIVTVSPEASVPRIVDVLINLSLNTKLSPTFSTLV